MSEVSSRICIRILDEFEGANMPVETLLAGLPFDADYIRLPSSRIRWDDFVTMLSRAAEHLGGTDALMRLGAQQNSDPSTPMFRTLARNFASVRVLYHMGARWHGPSLFRCTEARCVDLPDGRIEQSLRILPGYANSDEFFEVVRAALAAAPAMVGLPHAEVQMRREGSTAIYLITPPPSVDFMSRLWRFFNRQTIDRIRVQEAYQRRLEESLEETRISAAELANKSVRLETLNQLGRKLSEEKDPRLLAAEVCALLLAHSGIEGVELFGISAESGGLTSLHRSARGPATRIGSGHSEKIALRVGARLVGELHLTGASGSPADDQLRRELIPWIALALSNANAFAALKEQTHRLEREAVERQIAEQKFREAQKMEAVGRLAGGFAHDLNNALTVIGGFAELIRDQIPPDHTAQEDVDAIIEEEQRAARLIKQLLAFSRTSTMSLERLDLDLVVRDLERMLAQVVGARSTVEFTPGDGTHTVEADRGQIEQLIVNLVVNASDAMPTGGRITIGTGQHVDRDGQWVRLWIRDTGVGMDEKTRLAMFEPFFTTKDHGKGTGLGLAAVYGIVAERQGRIDVDTRLGEGTEIRIDFPHARLSKTNRPKTVPKPRALGGKETILVVDDDDRVRSVLRRSLSRVGYVVLEAESGSEALSLARSHGGAIDLLVTDIVMPGIDGREVGRTLIELRSELRGIVYVSGYAPQVVDGMGPLGEKSVFLRKPFTVEELLEAVRNLLDA